MQNFSTHVFQHTKFGEQDQLLEQTCWQLLLLEVITSRFASNVNDREDTMSALGRSKIGINGTGKGHPFSLYPSTIYDVLLST